MIISDVNRILGIVPGLVDRHFPSNGRTFHMMNDPAMHKRSESETEPERWYYDGLEYLAKGNYEVGRYLLEEAYKMGSDGAGNDYAYGLFHGWFGKRDYDTAVKIFRKLARQGDRDAMNNYAFAYLNGLGVKKNIHLAKFWLMKAIEKGNLDSAVSYAQLVFGGVFPRENWNLSVWLCFWAADNGNAGAMNELGLFYEEAAGMLKNYDKAFKWFKKSAEHGGGACAEFNVSRCYRYGHGVEIDEQTADAWQALAIEHGFDFEAYCNLYDL